MRKAEECCGQYGLLTVINRVAGKDTKNAYWQCSCTCGSEVVASGVQLRGGRSHCGARHHYHKDKGDMIRTPTYNSWVGAKNRCTNPNQPQWKDYGGRGITFCPRWLDSFANFLADMGTCPEGYSLDRIDGNKGYEPENCRWADRTTQNRNSRRVVCTPEKLTTIRSLAGTVSQTDIAHRTGVSVSTVNRVIRGVSWQ